jgi:hypothetical protein
LTYVNILKQDHGTLVTVETFNNLVVLVLKLGTKSYNIIVTFSVSISYYQLMKMFISAFDTNDTSNNSCYCPLFIRTFPKLRDIVTMEELRNKLISTILYDNNKCCKLYLQNNQYITLLKRFLIFV